MATGRDLHIDAPLSNLAVQAFNSGMDQFVAGQVMPIVDGLEKQSNKYYVIEKGQFLRLHDTKRAPKTMANRIEFSVSSNSYFCDEYALGTDRAIQDYANADAAINANENDANLVTLGLLRDYEQRVASIVTSISNCGSGAALTGGNKFSDYVNSDPLSYVQTGASFMRSRTGLVPNTAVIDWDTARILLRHPALMDMYKIQQGMLNLEQLKSAFEVDTLLVGKAIKENSKEGGATSSMTNIWGNNLVLLHVNKPQGLKTVTFGLSMRWAPAGFPAAMQIARQTFSGPGTKNIVVTEASYWQDEKVVASDLAYCIANTL